MLERWTRDVKEFCDKLGVEKPVVLGHSFGGFVATKYASMYADHPSKLIVSGSLAQFDSDVSTDRFGGRYKFSVGMSDAWVAFVDRDRSFCWNSCSGQHELRRGNRLDSFGWLSNLVFLAS
jgi:pimeloyl-ACP methyl ester carboxylesterase